MWTRASMRIGPCSLPILLYGRRARWSLSTHCASRCASTWSRPARSRPGPPATSTDRIELHDYRGNQHMSKIVLDMSMSLDGCIAGPEDNAPHGLGLSRVLNAIRPTGDDDEGIPSGMGAAQPHEPARPDVMASQSFVFSSQRGTN